METIPCLQCVSDSQLEMLRLYLWAALVGYTLPDDLQDILDASACNTCLSKTQMKRGELAMMAHAVAEIVDLPTVVDAAKCLPCVQPQQIQAAVNWLECQYWQSLNAQ